MKILLATSAAIPIGGGIASYNQELIKELGSQNEIHLLTDSDEKNVDGYKSTRSLYKCPITSFPFAKELVDDLNIQRFDLIINSRSAIMPFIVPFVNAPVISVAHFVNGIQADNAAYNQEYISHIVALSNYSKQYMESKFHMKSKNKVQVIYNFVASKGRPYDNSKEKSKTLTIVYPGGTSVQKSSDVVLSTVYRLMRSNLNFKFIWLGDSTLPSSNKSLFAIKTLNDLVYGDDRFVITGKVSREESIKQIETANVFLLPSRGEGCPMTLLEAMRVGCIPIVSDAKHGSRELLEDCKCGKIVKQGSSKLLFEAIVDVIIRHHEFATCYRKTYEYANNNLSHTIWRDKMMKLIKSSCLERKLTISLDEDAFNESKDGFLNLKKKDRIYRVCRSVLFRIFFDFSYLKQKYILQTIK